MSAAAWKRGVTMALTDKRINGVFLQKAILFAKIKEKAPDSIFGTISKKLDKLTDVVNGEDSVVAQMKDNDYHAIKVQYNPESLQITTQADINEKENAAGTDGDTSGTVALNTKSILSFQLIFEAAGTMGINNTVRIDAEGIVALMVSDITRNVSFYYGDIMFSGELISVDVQYKMFDSQGNPIWAEVAVSIKENDDDNNDENNDVKVNASETPKETSKEASKEFEKLSSEYGEFNNPVAVIRINGKDVADKKNNLKVSDLEVELSSGYEASIAQFSIYDCFDKQKSVFLMDSLKKYIMLGSSVAISTGYGEVAKNIFRGFISKVNFMYDSGAVPHVEITCMDIKVLMMAGNHAKQMTATSYSDAVNEIFEKPVYQKAQSAEIYTKLSVQFTPDKKAATTGQSISDKTIEMVNESDYEFVVRAAKKFNFEFFVDSGNVIFRKSKSVTEKLLELKLGHGIKNFNVEYDMTGLVENIQVRGMDSKKLKLIKSKRKWNNKISIGNKAKQFIKKSERIYTDPTVSNQQEADYRSEYLLEDMSYRFGTLTCECNGMPELKPGNLIDIKGLGTPADNQFYITSVKHIFNAETDYVSMITAKAAKLN